MQPELRMTPKTIRERGGGTRSLLTRSGEKGVRESAEAFAEKLAAQEHRTRLSAVAGPSKPNKRGREEKGE